jgi:enamine deaminase RidA (YjgF/YER057c/UK114 family)
MKKEYISPKGVYEPIGWSHAVKAGNTIYLAGMIGRDEQGKLVEGGFEAQAVKAFENIKLTLEAAGASLKDVVKMTIYFKIWMTSINSAKSEPASSHLLCQPAPVSKFQGSFPGCSSK